MPRAYNFNQPRQLDSGLKLVGTPAGPRNLEINGAAHVPSRCFLGNGIGSGTSSWWNGAGNLFDVYMADFGVQGDQGSSRQQFMDVPVTAGTLYACQFHALAFDFMRSIFGRKDRMCAFTQVVLSGHWTANNLWDTQFTFGGSDNSLWMGGYVNIGTSHPRCRPARTPTTTTSHPVVPVQDRPRLRVLHGSQRLAGHQGHGSSHGGLDFFGGVYEGYNGTNLRAPGPSSGSKGAMAPFRPRIGQAMAGPDPDEGGYVHMTDGQWNRRSSFSGRHPGHRPGHPSERRSSDHPGRHCGQR